LPRLLKKARCKAVWRRRGTQSLGPDVLEVRRSECRSKPTQQMDLFSSLSARGGDQEVLRLPIEADKVRAVPGDPDDSPDTARILLGRAERLCADQIDLQMLAASRSRSRSGC